MMWLESQYVDDHSTRNGMLLCVHVQLVGNVGVSNDSDIFGLKQTLQHSRQGVVMTVLPN